LKQGERAPEDCLVVRNALDAVLAEGARIPATSWGQPLVTFPH